jgi:hypothetical protein
MSRSHKLSDQDAQEIAARVASGDVSERGIAREYGVGRGTIRSIVTGSYWSGAVMAASTNPARSKHRQGRK